MSKPAFVPSRWIFALITFLTGFALPVAAAAEARLSEVYGQLKLHSRRSRMNRLVAVVVAALAVPAFAQTTLVGTTSTVNDGAGDQTDPHVSGDFVAYTSNADGTNRIRYHNLSMSTDAVVPNNGEDDFLSDISGNRIVFTRLSATSSIYTYTVGGASATEVAPAGDANRRNPAIGSSTVAWQDFGFSASALQPEIVVHDLTLGLTTRLTNDALLDRSPSVSPDGMVVVWAKCQTSGTGCDIWKAVGAGGTWTTSAVTGSEGEEFVPDTNGSIIVYASTRAGETDIYYKSVAGGVETRISLTGAQSNPSISGTLIAFDHRDASSNWDVMVYDTATATLYRLTSSAANETLNDIWTGADGFARVVYASDATGDSNVYAVSFVIAPVPPLQAVVLIIDEESIDNGNPPNFFLRREVNDDVAEIGVRAQLRFFRDNPDKTITLHTGQVGDEGWFALKKVPESWLPAGGLAGYIGNPAANPEDPPPHGTGPGLGAPDANGDRESLLDKVPDVTPLRATGLQNLVGRDVCAVVYDSDISINYDPLTGNLKGANLGTVAFKVLSVTPLTGYSSSSLPQVEIMILDAREACKRALVLLPDNGAPAPTSMWEPFDVLP